MPAWCGIRYGSSGRVSSCLGAVAAQNIIDPARDEDQGRFIERRDIFCSPPTIRQPAPRWRLKWTPESFRAIRDKLREIGKR